ncbi:MAG: uncharacterized protein A8A55_3529, partial [Amphiamblys sp. WSBS2006]
FLEEENSSLWIGSVKGLDLRGYAVELFPKLRFHEENVMKKLVLNTDKDEHIAGILQMENNSIWVGKVESLELCWYAVGILPKLRTHDENVMEKLILKAYEGEYPTEEILQMKNNSIWVGKVKSLNLYGNAIRIFPKLKFHEENVVEELVLRAYNPGDITGILGMENNSIWIGKI